MSGFELTLLALIYFIGTLAFSMASYNKLVLKEQDIARYIICSWLWPVSIFLPVSSND
jgi:hypothetical protein